jgi:hypothetical protein
VLVDRLGHVGGAVGVLDPDGVPADPPLPEQLVLLEEILAEEELRGVGLLLLAVVDPHQLELPDVAASFRPPRRGLDGDAVAELPVVLVGDGAADDGPVRVRSQAAFCSAGSLNSGYIARYSSGLTGNWAMKFFGSW